MPTVVVPEVDMTVAETVHLSQSSSSSDPVHRAVYREARGSVQKERSGDNEAGRAAKKAKAEVVKDHRAKAHEYQKTVLKVN